MKRRDFLKLSAVTVGAITTVTAPAVRAAEASSTPGRSIAKARGKGKYNGTYGGERTNRVAFPMGGMGAGMICLEGTGALSHVSLRHRPEVFNEPNTFAAISVKGAKPVARVLEGPVPVWKKFGQPGTGNGAAGTSFGLPRFREATFRAQFPFGTVAL